MRISDWSSDVCSSDLRNGANWQGTLASLDLAPAKGATWHLQSPARYAQRGSNWTLSQSCFAASDGGALSAIADWPRGGLVVEGQGLDRKSVVLGTSVSVRLDPGGCRVIITKYSTN